MSKLHIYRRQGESPHWQAQVYVGSKRYRFSCRTTDKATAHRFAKQQARQLQTRHDRGLTGLAETVHMSQVFDRYEHEYAPRLRPSAHERTRGVFKQAREWFEHGPLHDADVKLVAISYSPPKRVQSTKTRGKRP